MTLPHTIIVFLSSSILLYVEVIRSCNARFTLIIVQDEHLFNTFEILVFLRLDTLESIDLSLIRLLRLLRLLIRYHFGVIVRYAEKQN